jgi:hypothetical protein
MYEETNNDDDLNYALTVFQDYVDKYGDTAKMLSCQQQEICVPVCFPSK